MLRTLLSQNSRRDFRFSKQRRPFLDPIAFPKENPRFEKPPLTNNVNLVLPLGVIVPDVVERAQETGTLIFHAIGDSGGSHGDETQRAVAEAMEAQIVPRRNDNPGFAYHLGDVIYFNGQSDFYPSQFYDPYKY